MSDTTLRHGTHMVTEFWVVTEVQKDTLATIAHFTDTVVVALMRVAGDTTSQK